MTTSATPQTEYSFDLCVAYRSKLHGHAVQLTRNGSDAEDLVQETLVKAWRAWERFRPAQDMPIERAVAAWLHEILLNTFLSEYRRQSLRRSFAANRRHDVLLAAYGQLDEDEPQPLPGEEYSDDLLEAMDRLGEISARWRKVVERAYGEGVRYREVADELHVPMGTVMSSLNRARTFLVEQLTPYAAREYRITDHRHDEDCARRPGE